MSYAYLKPFFDVTKTVFDNGLTLLTLEKHNVPIVSSMIWYNVGSAHEKPGQTGISHFLEHVMFKGTHTYAKGEIDFLTSTHGGNNNAGTIFDYTMYYFNFSSDRWEIALEIEADRMQHCIFEPNEFEAERNVILEELKQYQDSPWGELGTQLETTMFREHPYQHPVIGWKKDIEQLSRDMLRDYYHTYYVPNNAIIVVAGDIDTAAAIEKVRQCFAHIPPNPSLPELNSCEVQQHEERRFTVFQDTNVKRVHIGYHAPAFADKSSDVLDLVDYLLCHGKTSRLYQRLVEHAQLVNFVDTYNHPRKFSGVFHVFAALRPEISPETVERILDEELERLRVEKIQEQELQKVKNGIIADFIFEQETASGIAHNLGEYESFHTYHDVNNYVERIEKITPGDILRVTQSYLVRNNRTVGWSLPEHPEQERNASVFNGLSALPPPDEMVSYQPGGCTGFEGVHGFAAQPSTLVPEMFFQNSQRFRHHRWILENGLRVLFIENHEFPVVSLEAYVDADQLYELEEQAGVAVLTGQLLDEGTNSHSGFEIAQLIESVGASLDTQSKGVSAQVLSKDVKLIMGVISDVLMHPIFTQEQFEKKRLQILASFDSDNDNLPLLAFYQFCDMIYGTHPYHRPRKGYRETLQNLTRTDVMNFYRTHFRPNNTILTVVGDAEPEEILEDVQGYFDSWEYREPPCQPAFTIPQPEGCVRKHIDKSREQTHIYLGHLGVTRTNPDFYTLFTMDHILGTGSGFTDRISRKLRDEQGLAYAVSANISASAGVEPGVFAAYIATSPENTDQAIEGFLDEIRKIRTERVLEEELELAQNYISGSYVFNFETSNQLARYLINVERYRLGEDFIWNFPQLIHRITVDDIQRVAWQYLDPDNYYIASGGRNF